MRSGENMFPAGRIFERPRLHSLRFIWLPQNPKYQGKQASSRRPWILSVPGRKGVIALSVVEFENLSERLAGRCKFAELHRGRSNRPMAHDHHRLIAQPPGERQAFLTELQCLSRLPYYRTVNELPVQRGEQPFGFTKLLAEHGGSLV